MENLNDIHFYRMKLIPLGSSKSKKFQVILFVPGINRSRSAYFFSFINIQMNTTD